MSEGSITFTPLLGASEHEPLAYLLDIDGFKILLDCGWNAEFNIADIEPLVKCAFTIIDELVAICCLLIVLFLRVIDQIDIILLSHNDLQHLGALPYLRRSGLQCPVYATVPVWRMGQLAVRDALLSHTNAYKFDTFTTADVDAAFGAIQTVKHMQVTSLSGRGGGITITSGLAGHSVGGAIWRITKGSEDVVYAVDFNHAKENHLDGFLPDADRRTTILISNAINARAELPKRKDRQTQMLQSVLNTLKRGGNVLLPSDSAARVLEVCTGCSVL
jgi:cleavage and polyadenylation specificity factor subunit 2